MMNHRTKQQVGVLAKAIVEGEAVPSLQVGSGKVTDKVNSLVRNNRELIIKALEDAGLDRRALAVKVVDRCRDENDQNSWDAVKTALKIYGAFDEVQQSQGGDIIINIASL